MKPASKFKIIALAVIYILHVAFFDVLMNHEISGQAGIFISNVSACNHDNSNPQNGNDYRLLTKHDQFKQIKTSVPLVFNSVFTSLDFTSENLNFPTQFGAVPELTIEGNKLYRIFGSFLI